MVNSGLGLVVLALTLSGLGAVDSRSSCVEAIWQREFLYHTFNKGTELLLDSSASRAKAIVFYYVIFLSL